MSRIDVSGRLAPLAAALLVSVWLSACGGGRPAGTAGAAVHVTVGQGLSVQDVQRVHVEVSGPGIVVPVSGELTRNADGWGGVVEGIPSGGDRVFEATAYGASGEALYQGRSPPVRIKSGGLLSLSLLLQQVNAPPPLENEAPFIGSFLATEVEVAPGANVVIWAGVSDPNPGDVLTSAWSASAGTFESTSDTTASWTAPAEEGVVQLRLTVTDQKGASTTGTVEVVVRRDVGTGRAAVFATFNTWPRVTSLDADPAWVAVGETTHLVVRAEDADGDAMFYRWSSDCEGTFSDASTAAPSFTLTAAPAGWHCRFVVTVHDVRGGSHAAALGVPLGGAPTVELLPVVDAASQSATQAAGGERVTFSLTAHDPEGGPVWFSWMADSGSIVAQRDSEGSSEVDWVAPPCFNTTTTIIGYAHESSGASRGYAFMVFPREGGSCDGQTVAGVDSTLYVLADGSTQAVPSDLSQTNIVAWIPTEDGTGYERRVGTGTPAGTFSIPGVSRTPYLLQVGGRYLWTSQLTVDLSGVALGRPDVVREPSGVMLSVRLQAPTPWQAGDGFQLIAPNAGIGFMSNDCFLGADFEEGSTSLATDLDYVAALQRCYSTPARLEPERGDRVWATRLVSSQLADGAATLQAVQSALEVPSLGDSQWGPLLLEGTLAPLPTVTQVVDWRAAAFEVQARQGTPAAEFLDTFFSIGTLPGASVLPAARGWPDLAAAHVSAPGASVDAVHSFAYGDPYPATWTRFVEATTVYGRWYTATLPDGRMATPRRFTLFTTSRVPMVPGSPVTLTPRVGPIRALKVNGLDASDTLTDVGLSPVLSWDPPALGVPDAYLVRVWRITSTLSGVTTRVLAGLLRTSDTRVRLPDDMLIWGEPYMVDVLAESRPGADPARPYADTPEQHQAGMLSGTFIP